MRITRYDEIVRGERFVAHFNDFPEGEDKVRNWQEAFFSLLSWKNTWGNCEELTIRSSRVNGTFVDMLIVDQTEGRDFPDFVIAVEQMMEDLGYKPKHYQVQVRKLYVENEPNEDICDYIVDM